MTVTFDGDLVIISGAKMVLVLTRAQFLAALRWGKAYRRQKVMQQRTQEPR